MGEFAKNKIMEILEYLNDSKNEVQLKTINEKQINPIIESIGEDFLRNKLLNLYHNKLTQEEKEKEKQILKNKIDELQRQYDELNK
jgi:repressor of nif and glnA expression